MTDDGQHVLRYIRTIEGMLNKLEIEYANLRDNYDYSISERASAYERIEELEDCFFAAEGANLKHLARIERLEKLCKDFWNTLRWEMDSDWQKSNRPRMEQLGLLDGEQ